MKLVNTQDFDSCIPLFESERRSQYLGVVQLGERLFWEQEVAGAKPATQTNQARFIARADPPLLW